MQRDVVAESEEILKLGLLFGEDIEATTDDLPEVLSFQHKLIQEYLAAVYIADNATSSAFLAGVFPSLNEVNTHREVVLFACGIMKDAETSPVVNHVAKLVAQHIHNELNTAKDLPDFSILTHCQEEGGLSAINPFISEYPVCGRPLADVLASTELALQLSPSPAQIILNLSSNHIERHDRLWEALHAISANVIAYCLITNKRANASKLRHFSQLKYLNITACTIRDCVMEDLAESIEAWGPRPPLRYLDICYMTVPISVLSSLWKCTNLMHLDLSGCNLNKKISVFVASPPHALRELILMQCSLNRDDIAYIRETIVKGQFANLKELSLVNNPIGEAAVSRLLKTLLSTRPHMQLTLQLALTGLDGTAWRTLPQQFQCFGRGETWRLWLIQISNVS